jgi:hypothetical protein
MISKPSPFCFGEGFMTQGILARKTGSLQERFLQSQERSFSTLTPSFGKPSRHASQKPESVLQVIQLSYADEPLPIQFWKL